VFDFLGTVIMDPLYWVISVILLGWHRLFSVFLDPDSGWSWALSIVGLTAVIRAAMIPLFVRQIKASRNMQLIQPKVKALQEKYGHDRELLAQKTMELYKDSGTNPFASCLPIFLQMPIFFALFRLLNAAARDQPKGVLTEAQVDSLSNATIFGAKISDSFTSADSINVQLLAGFLVLAMTATTFLTQRQLMAKNMPADAMSGPYARQQKMLLYVLPLVFAIGGIAFPIGVLLYWTTSNLWTMSQQFYVIRNNPAPGTPAFAAKEQRDAHRRARKGLPEPTVANEVEQPTVEEEPPRPQQRQQPKRQSRQERKKQRPQPGSKPSSEGAGDEGDPGEAASGA
jgi:YidC/Oxa1 family membrane protein insertase